MSDLKKTKQELIDELKKLRRKVKRLEREAERGRESAKALKDAEDKYNAFVSGSLYSYVEFDLDGNLTFINKVASEIMGYSIETHPGLNIKDVIRKEDHERMFKGLELSISASTPVPRAYKLRMADGSIKHYEISTLPIKKGGKTIGLRSTGHDITERVKALEALSESERRYRLLADNVSDIIWVRDMNLVLTYISPSVERMRGYTVEEALKHRLDEVLTPEGMEMAMTAFREELELEKQGLADPMTVKTFEWEETRKDGSRIWVEVRASFLRDADNKHIGILGVTRDISQRKKAELALREMTDNFTGLYEAAFEGIIIHDKGKILDVNEAMAKMFGYKRDEVIGTSMMNYAAVDCVPVIMANIQSGSREPYEAVGVKKDGSKLVAEVTGRPFVYKGREVRLTSVRDITKRKEAEDALRESEKLYRTLVETSPDAIFLLDMDFNILMANSKAATMLGIENANDLIGQSSFNFVKGKEYGRAIENAKKLRKDGSYETVEYLITRSDRTEINLEINTSFIFDDYGKQKAFVLVARDITEKRKMEEERTKIGKLESIGFLAGGIAHDFNNILAGILSNISLAKLHSESNDRALERLNEAEKAILRATNLTTQLLTFSKGGAPIKETAGIYEVIRETADFVLSGSRVVCEMDIPDSLWQVKFDVGQISQVVNNLILNSKQAMPEGGCIRITAQNVTLEDDSGLPLEKGEYIKLAFVDEGVGIKPEHLQKIFDPYFTTKQNGSGLGLTTTYSIIRKHDGHISVESELGKHTTFYIYLPASDSQETLEEPESAGPLKGSGRVLMMDDEVILREAAGELIEYLGYEVEYADDGNQALTMYQDAMADGRPFDLVIMDLTVPGGVGGKEAVGKILKIDPRARVIVSSGYSRDPVMADYTSYGFRGVLNKPYKLEEMSRIIGKAIKEED